MSELAISAEAYKKLGCKPGDVVTLTVRGTVGEMTPKGVTVKVDEISKQSSEHKETSEPKKRKMSAGAAAVLGY